MRGLNRAEICDVNFSEFVREWNGHGDVKPSPDEAILEGSELDARGFLELFESQLISRHLDLMARVLRVQNKVYYKIGRAQVRTQVTNAQLVCRILIEKKNNNN